MSNFFETCKTWLGLKPTIIETNPLKNEDTFIPHHGAIGDIYVELQICHGVRHNWMLENVRLRLDNKLRFVGLSRYLGHHVELSTNIVHMLIENPDRVVISNGQSWINSAFKTDGLEKHFNRVNIFHNCESFQQSLASWNLEGIGENLHV